MQPAPSSKPASAALANVLLLGCLAGCGDDPPPPPPAPPPPATAPAPAASTPRPRASASAAASASTSTAAPIASFAPASGPLRWADFGGPDLEPPVKAGERAWAVLPVSVGWETLRFAVLPVTKIEDAKLAVFEIASGDTKTEAFVPGAFTAPLQPPDKLNIDDAVMIATGGARAFGRVASPPADQKVKVRYRFAGSLEEKDVPLDEVLKLDGTLKFGAPVAFSEERDEGTKRRVVWRPGSLVHSADGKAWVINFGRPIRVPLTAVKPMTVATLHRAGDKVWVANNEELLPGQVAEVQDSGIRYKVKLEDSSELTASLENVTAPINAAGGAPSTQPAPAPQK
ncbi:MAG: hypothetical protein JNL21_13115 [Myxococcales bacterium]|nr:hypothetical protein [Myxococcales bacterium]